MSDAVYVGVHAYTQMENGREPHPVWKDRLSKAREIAAAFTGYGFDVTLVFLGGAEFNGMDVKKAMYRFAQGFIPETVTGCQVAFVDQTARNTNNEILAFTEFLLNAADGAFAVSVSSWDHTPRIQRAWCIVQQEVVLPCPVFAVGHENSYTVSGDDPFVLEAGKFHPFIDAFNEVWDVSEGSYRAAANEVATVLRSYH